MAPMGWEKGMRCCKIATSFVIYTPTPSPKRYYNYRSPTEKKALATGSESDLLLGLHYKQCLVGHALLLTACRERIVGLSTTLAYSSMRLLASCTVYA